MKDVPILKLFICSHSILPSTIKVFEGNFRYIRKHLGKILQTNSLRFLLEFFTFSKTLTNYLDEHSSIKELRCLKMIRLFVKSVPIKKNC